MPRRSFSIFLSFSILFCLLFQTPVYGKEKIRWLVWELTPEFIKTGPFAGQGYADKFLKFFKQNLQRYDHEIHWLNVARWSSEALKPNRCSVHLWGGFFPDKLVLSKPYTFTAPHMLIAHKRNISKIGVPGETVSIVELLNRGDLTLITMPLILDENAEIQQSRYPLLFPHLKPFIGTSILKQSFGARNEVDLRILNRQGADISLGYPSTITAQRKAKNLPDDYVSYSLKEHNLYKKIYVGCFNDSFGRQVIKDVNNLLTLNAYQQFLQYHEEWNEKNLNFRKTYTDYFINEKDLVNVVD